MKYLHNICAIFTQYFYNIWVKFSRSQPSAQICACFYEVRKYRAKITFQWTKARSEPQNDSQLILNIPRFEPNDSYSYKEKS